MCTAYCSREKFQRLKDLEIKIKNDPNNFSLWNSKYNVYMDIGCNEGALDCCNEMLRLKPNSEDILQKKERLKYRIEKRKEIRIHPQKNTEKLFKMRQKELKKLQKKTCKEKHEDLKKTVSMLKVNIPKECSIGYTPNTKYQLRPDANKIRKFTKW